MIPTETDVQQNKVMAILGYILFFVPLLAAKESPFAQYHARQGLNLFLLALASNIVLNILWFVGWLLLPFVNIGILVLAIIGILAAANGQMKPLPLIGKYQILK